MWLIVLSDQLPIAALGGHYPPNQLIGHRPIFQRDLRHFASRCQEAYAVLSAISRRYPSLEGRYPCVTHPSATRSPTEAGKRVRLACVRHAASVYPEPGSNSPSNVWCFSFSKRILCIGARDPGQALVVQTLGCSQIVVRLHGARGSASLWSHELTGTGMCRETSNVSVKTISCCIVMYLICFPLFNC